MIFFKERLSNRRRALVKRAYDHLVKAALCLFLPLIAHADPKPKLTICYFSFNTDQEFKTMDGFVNRIEKYSKFDIEVKEWVNRDGERPEDSFDRLLESKTNCQGLVFSGHHSGSFGGKHANGKLTLEYLERAACELKNSEFFSSVKTLWLQGCNTMGNAITARTSDYMRNANTRAQAIYHHNGENSLDSGLLDLVNEMSSTLDQGNPLSSRYQRIFPAANVFGWNGSAPSESGKSNYSLPFHIANTARILAKKDSNYSHPLEDDLSSQDQKAYIQALEAMLGDFKDINQSPEACQDAVLEGWKKHGGLNGGLLTDGWWKLTTNVHSYRPALLLSKNERLAKAAAIRCQLIHEKDPKRVSEILKLATGDEKLLAMVLNPILDWLKRNEGNDEFKSAVNELKKNDIFKKLLTSKLSEEGIGISRRLDYLNWNKKFYPETQVTEVAKNSYKNQVNEILTVKRTANASTEENATLTSDKKQMLDQALRSHILEPNELVKDFSKYQEKDPKFLSILLHSLDQFGVRDEATLASLNSKIKEVYSKNREGFNLEKNDIRRLARLSSKSHDQTFLSQFLISPPHSLKKEFWTRQDLKEFKDQGVLSENDIPAISKSPSLTQVQKLSLIAPLASKTLTPELLQARESLTDTLDLAILSPETAVDLVKSNWLPEEKLVEETKKKLEKNAPIPEVFKEVEVVKKTLPPDYSYGAVFVTIPAGSFLMGSPSAEENRYDSETQHEVTLTKSFEMQTTEVTQAQWREVMGNMPSNFKGDNLPVEKVNWNDAKEFIKKLNEKVADGYTYRLPTEAEWEYAARAGTTTAYITGQSPDKMKDYAWYSDNSGNQTHTVGRLKPNAFGLYDMIGNVWEWVEDGYQSFSAQSVSDPQGFSLAPSRVIRGGGWNDDTRYVRSALRNFHDPSYRSYGLGFRPLRTAK